MSRIGKQPIEIPAGVTITVGDSEITVAGPKGQLIVPVQPKTKTTVEGTVLTVTRSDDEPKSRAWHGLQRALINNAVVGVTKGYEKKLEINGVGYRLSGGGQEIEMALGFSHPVKYKAPEGVQLTTNKMEITVSGIDKQKVGQVAAEIRALKKPEPYKGKGIKYADEVILRKAGKAVADGNRKKPLPLYAVERRYLPAKRNDRGRKDFADDGTSAAGAGKDRGVPFARRRRECGDTGRKLQKARFASGSAACGAQRSRLSHPPCRLVAGHGRSLRMVFRTGGSDGSCDSYSPL